MPIYEYECQACGYHLEVIQKMSDAPVVACPACGKTELKKLISAAGFRLSGTGWYETDFKGKGKGKGKQNVVDKDGKPKDTPKPAAASKPEKTSAAGAGQKATKN